MSDSSFRIEVIQKDSTPPIIELTGWVDVNTIPQLRQQMFQLYETGATDLIVDLTNVDYLNQTAVLIGAHERFHKKGGNLAIVCPSPRIRRVFEITSSDKILNIFNTVEEAQESLAKTAATA